MSAEDLARELEELLCDCDRRLGYHGDHWASCAWRVRGPAVLAFARAKLAKARADSELLDWIAATLRREDTYEIQMFRRDQGDMAVRLVVLDKPRVICTAPTLREALRKLVESES